MNVALLTPELFSAEGGLSRILRLYLKGLCELASPTEQVRLVTLIDPTLSSVDLQKYAGGSLDEKFACDRSKFAFLRHAFRVARSSDLLICGHIGQLPVAWLAAKLYPRLRYILIAHGLEVWREFGPIERAALHRASCVWCVSEYTRQQLLRHSGLPAERAVVLPNALDPSLEFLPVAKGETAPVILSVSRLSWSDRYKGIDHLIEALPAVRQVFPHATLRVVGSGDDLLRLKKLAEEKQVADAVEFLGYLEDVDLKQEFAASRIFALPSEREGFGLVYLEAMAQGKPCVGANAGGTPEVIDDASGLLSPFGDIPALASALIEALQRPWNTAAIRARAEVFSYQRFRERLCLLLQAEAKRVPAR